MPRAGDRRAVADRLRDARDLGGRHDEPRGGRARHARLHDVRGPPGGGRRAADRRGPAAPLERSRRARPRRVASRRWRSSHARAIHACSWTCCSRPCTAARPGLAERLTGAYNPAQCADGSARRPSPCTATRCPSSRWTGCWSRSRTTSPSSCASTRPDRLLRAPARTHDLVGARGQPAGARAGAASTSAAGATSGQRDYEAVARAVVAIVLLAVVAVEVFRPVCTHQPHGTVGGGAAERRDRAVRAARAGPPGRRARARAHASTSAARWRPFAAGARTSAAC